MTAGVLTRIGQHARVLVARTRVEHANRRAWHPWWCRSENLCTGGPGGTLHEGAPSRFPGDRCDEVAVRALLRDGQPGVSIAAYGPADGTTVDLDLERAVGLAKAILACADQAATCNAGSGS